MSDVDDQPADRFRSVFWDDLAEDLQDPEFRRAYSAESRRIQAIDQAVNAAIEAGVHPDFFAGMSPTEIADWVDRHDPAGR